MRMNTLDKDRLKGLIQTLQFASKTGFSSLSSPIEFLLEAAIDLSLLLSSQFQEGKLDRISNKEVRFLDNQQDSLGNPKQISFRKKRKMYWDPEASKFLRKLSLFFVHLKNHNPFSRAYMALEEEKILPPTRRSSEQKTQKKKKQQTLKKNAAYYRRQRLKRKT
jgi:hypothetical protein